MRYFFNVRIGARLIADTEGAIFPTLEAARAEAVSAARELVGLNLTAGADVDWTSAIEIVAEDLVVETVSFLEAAGIAPKHG